MSNRKVSEFDSTLGLYSVGKYRPKYTLYTKITLFCTKRPALMAMVDEMMFDDVFPY